EGGARGRLPRGIERDQFARHLAGLFAHAPRGALPLVAADLVDLGRRTLRADRALEPVNLIGRNEQAVAALVLDQEIVAQILFYLTLDQSAIDADAMMNMDDKIVLAQIENGRDRHAPRHAPPRDDRACAAEEFGVG